MSNCDSCGKRPPEPVPYVVHESDMARLERTIKRLWILLLVMLVLLVGTNGAWIYYESQFVEETTTVEQDIETGDGDAFVAGVGDVNYGQDKAESDQENPNP